MNKWVELLLGLILILGAVILAFYSHSEGWGLLNFFEAARITLLGGIFWAVVGLGGLFILLGISDLKN